MIYSLLRLVFSVWDSVGDIESLSTVPRWSRRFVWHQHVATAF